MLTVTWLHLADRLMGCITAKLTVAPTALKARLKILPNKMATRVTRIRDRKQASWTQSVQSEDGHRIGQAHLHAGHRDGQGNRDSR